MNVGCGGDREVQRSPPWRSTSLRDEGVQSSTLARCRGVEWQCVEMVLDGAKPAHAQSACFLITGDEYTEVKLGQRNDADGRIVFWSFVGGYED